MEKIVAAALQTGNGKIYTGPAHFAAMLKILDDPTLDDSTKEYYSTHNTDRFVTTKKRFVSREEGFEIALKAGQLLPNELADPENNKKFYGGDKPRLDSGLLPPNYTEEFHEMLEYREYFT